MITINPNKSKTLTFKVDITGSSTQPIARLVFPMKNDSSMMFNALIENNIVKVNIPPLNPVYHDMLGKAKLELIVGEFYFSPWQGEFEFKEEPNVSSAQLEEEEKPNVSMNNAEIITEVETKVETKVILEDTPEPEIKQIIPKQKSKFEKKLTVKSPIRKILE
jgi:hypothetical protein